MNRPEALKILGLESSATEDDIKTAFRKKAAKMHPDVNKEENAEKRYKEISEAYEYLKSGKQDIDAGRSYRDMADFFRRTSANPFVDINFNPMRYGASNARQSLPRIWRANPASTQVTISFNESILGCAKKIKIDRYKDCPSCFGAGMKLIDKLCADCGGSGGKVQQNATHNGLFVMHTTCGTCMGSGKITEPCATCDKRGFEKENVELNIQIPPGVRNDSLVRLRYGGNIKGNSREDALIGIIVLPEENMQLIDQDVVSTINVSLYNALQGCEYNAKTVLGDTTIKIPERSKNKEEVTLDGYGVATKGKHRFILNVEYPDNIEQLLFAIKE